MCGVSRLIGPWHRGTAGENDLTDGENDLMDGENDLADGENDLMMDSRNRGQDRIDIGLR